MSDRVKKHRQYLSDLGISVVECRLPKQDIQKLENTARFHGVSRTLYLSTFLKNILNEDSFLHWYNQVVLKCDETTKREKELRSALERHREFTDYTLS